MSAKTQQRKFLVLLATTTQEKVAEYSAISRLLNIPLVFANFREVMGFHATEEDKGDRIAHAREKSQELDGKVELLIHSKKHNAALKALCAQHGVDYDLDNIIAASEDTSLSLDRTSWEGMRDVIGQYLPEDIMEKAERGSVNFDGMEFSGPNSEFGIVTGAIGSKEFFRYAQEEVLKNNASGITLTSATMVVRRFSDPSSAQKGEFSGTVLRRVLPNPLTADQNSERWVTTAEHHVGLLGDHTTPIANIFSDYLRDHTQRSQIVKSLYSHLCAMLTKKVLREFTSAQKSVTTPKSFNGCFACSGKIPNLSSISGKPKTFAADQTSSNPYMRTLDISKSLTDSSDSYIFAPYNPMNAKEHRKRMFWFFSALVEKSIETASVNKPIIVMNDGCYAPALRVYLHLINSGMAKDFDRVPELEIDASAPFSAADRDLSSVRHKPFGLFDLVSTERKGLTLSILGKAADKVLAKRKKEYSKSVAHEDKQKTGPSDSNAEYKKSALKVAIFTTASSDNSIVSKAAGDTCDGIAKMNWFYGADISVVWGGGDRHGMGAVNAACLDNGLYHEGYSTHPILVMESKHGSMPQCDYSEISPNIFHRMAKMIEASDVISILPGGFGTVQELLAVLVLMDEQPELMKGKSLILHNQDINGTAPFMDLIIEAALGKDALRKMHANHHALADKGIYMVSSSGEHLNVIKNISAQNKSVTPSLSKQKQTDTHAPA